MKGKSIKPIISARNLVHEYYRRDEEGNVTAIENAVDDVSLDVEPGQFISILGHNGSGKSTLAKHINALLLPTEGSIYVDGKDTSAPENELPVREEAGMVFQNPDNQIIASVVEEDVGFGPENIGIPTDQIWARVERALKGVGMWEYRKKSPNRLSGGQKQRVAIAGVMAMEPKCIILDEPTAMLDPDGRAEVIATARELNKKKGVTIILITHYMEEVVFSDKVFVMDHGKIVMQGSPRDIFSQADSLRSYHLCLPQVTELACQLKAAGLKVPDGVLTREELMSVLTEGGLLSKEIEDKPEQTFDKKEKKPLSDAVLLLDHVSVTYQDGGSSTRALEDVSLQINRGDFLGIIGHTGSGKSTLIQTLNGLIAPSEGHIYFNGQDIGDDGFDKRGLRSQVGMVFQYPEHQLFEATVIEDVKFGPRNQGLSDRECELMAYEALQRVHFPEDSYEASPFELSGGQKRRAAIAGVLAMRPSVIILDEPTAGLDPAGRDEILGLIKEMHDKSGETVILVSHSMEDVADYVDRIIVVDKGRIASDGTPREVFSNVRQLESMGLAVPSVTYLLHDLRAAGYPVDCHGTTVSEAKEEILRCSRI